MPEDAEYLWRWHQRLSNRRQIGMAPCPISWPQIESFFRLERIRPDEWEVRTIEMIDDAWMRSASGGK